LPLRPGSRPRRRVSSPQSAVCIAVRRPWMDPCVTRWVPCCRTRPLSRRCTRRRDEMAPPAHPPRCGLCSCAGLRRAAIPGTSRCLRDAARKDVHIASEPRRILKELQIEERPRSKTHRVGRAVYP
jgi:hypothetical protein